MESIVLFYSRSGNTRFVAEHIARELKADIEEITEKRDRKGIIGWFAAGRDAMKGQHSDINPLAHDLKKFDTIIIGQPVWAWTMVPAIRGLAKHHDLHGKNIALFCTMDGSGAEKVFLATEKLFKGKIIAAKPFIKPSKDREKTSLLIKEFCQDIKNGIDSSKNESLLVLDAKHRFAAVKKNFSKKNELPAAKKISERHDMYHNKPDKISLKKTSGQKSAKKNLTHKKSSSKPSKKR